MNINTTGLALVSILVIVIMAAIIPQVGHITQAVAEDDRELESISVFILDEGTTATHVTCAIYDANTNRLIRTTEEQLITPDTWNVCSFEINPVISTPGEYVLVAFGDGDLSIPADGSNYVTDTGNTYATFPQYLDYDENADSQLSIYAIYK